MGCGSCSSGSCTPAGCKSNGACMTDGGCSKLDVHDWLSDMDMPTNYKPFDVIEVRFKGSRKDFYRNVDALYLEAGELVVVEGNAGGYDIGHVTMTGELVKMQLKKHRLSGDAESIKKVYRKATEADVEKWKLAKSLEKDTQQRARTIITELNLNMKLSDVDYQGDKTKATFYYTAEDRVDFRELIKRLAENFRVRIEMRQIGMRQEASRLGGIGSCGRELCCSTWLTEFKTVSTAAARYQNLSLNTSKLAGQCGKLKCCLNYELDTYMDALRQFPKDVERLETKKGHAYLRKTDIFKKLMWFSYAEDENWIPLEIPKVNEIIALNKKGEKPIELVAEIAQPEIQAIKSYDYENVVGQDSLTRLDDRKKQGNRNKKRNPNRNKNVTDVAKNTRPNQNPNQNKNNKNRGKDS